MTTSLRANLRALPAPVWILFGGTFINRFGTFVMPFLVIYLTRNGYSPAQAGLAVSAYGGGHLVASMLGGHLADALGRKYTIALSMFCSAAAMVALSQARGIGAILALACVAGVSAELYRPASGALLGDLVAPEQRITAFAMYRLAVNLGFAIGPATAGLLADRSFVYVFIGDAITSTLFGIITLTLLPHGLRHQTRDESAMTGIRIALRDRVFVRFLIATLCITWIEFQIHSTLPLYVVHQGFTASTYGMLISINGVMIVIFELAIIAWTQRFKPQPVIALGYALSAIGFALTGLAHSLPALAMTVVVWTIGEMIYAPVTGAFVTSLAPERYRGRYHGLWIFTWSVGMLLGPAFGTLLYERAQPVLWIACATMGLVAAAMSFGRAPSDLRHDPAPAADSH